MLDMALLNEVYYIRVTKCKTCQVIRRKLMLNLCKVFKKLRQTFRSGKAL